MARAACEWKFYRMLLENVYFSPLVDIHLGHEHSLRQCCEVFHLEKRAFFLRTQYIMSGLNTFSMLLLDVNILMSCFCHLLSLFVLPWSIDLLSRVVLWVSPTSLPAHYFHPLPYRMKLVSIEYVCAMLFGSHVMFFEQSKKKIGEIVVIFFT